MTLGTIRAAQEDFRENDRDRNGARDYWRGDLRRLYSLGLIEPSVADADDRPSASGSAGSAPHPKGGFWYRAILLPGETLPDPSRWAASCHPAEYGPGILSTYVIREDGVVWRKDLGHGNGIDRYPANPQAQGWTRVEGFERSR